MEAVMDRTEPGRDGLDPGRDPRRWEAVVGGIMLAAEPELERRRVGVSLTNTLLAWARPALSAAATIALLISASAMLMRGGAGEAADAGLADALMPEAVAAWLVAGYQPTVTEVVVALEEVVR
jgi:hypothetical protein